MSDYTYQQGFGNEFASEAVPGALPAGRNSPQRAPLGLYAEQLSGTAFTQPRAVNRRTWVYRIMPSAAHPRFSRIANGSLRGTPFDEIEPDPNRLRWDPLPMPTADTDFIDGLYTVAGNGDLRTRNGMAVHQYVANQSMTSRYFVDSDGELLFVPEAGPVTLHTELGPLAVAPGEIAVIPRGIRFRVELPAEPVRGYLCENFGAAFTLPERGPIGANGLANERDFLAPTARYEQETGPVQVVQKFGGNLWAADYDHSPLDVVGWHGNYAPYKYDTANFMVIGTISFDHPDPSIFTVLTSPSELPGLANVDFVIFPPRWLVGEDTFRPPWYHRNIMSEFMGLVHGVYDAKAEGFVPGGASLHNTFTSHGPDAETFARASTAELRPQKIDGTLAFMFESRWMIIPTQQAMRAGHRQQDYDAVWASLTPGSRHSLRGGGTMYIPAHFAADDSEVRELLAKHGAADLITLTDDGLLATMLPFAYEPSAGEHGAQWGALYGHVARNNDQWRKPARGESLAIVRGPDSYVSPSWYAAKAEHGRVVPTWNYLTAHVYGQLLVHDDPAVGGGRRPPPHRQARGRPPGLTPPATRVVGGRRAARVHRGPAARHRRPGAADHPDRGQGQAEPEPPGRRHRRHRRRPRRPRRRSHGHRRRARQRRPLKTGYGGDDV